MDDFFTASAIHRPATIKDDTDACFYSHPKASEGGFKRLVLIFFSPRKPPPRLGGKCVVAGASVTKVQQCSCIVAPDLQPDFIII